MSVRGWIRPDDWKYVSKSGPERKDGLFVYVVEPPESHTVLVDLREVRDDDQPTREELVGGVEMAESELAAICVEAPHLGFTTLNRLHNLLRRERGEVEDAESAEE